MTEKEFGEIVSKIKGMLKTTEPSSNDQA
jgi:hypothetical protein